MARVTYNREHRIPLLADEQGELAYIMVRQQVENGQRVRFCVSLLARRHSGGRMREVVRYDDHGGFHRHGDLLEPGAGKTFLEPGENPIRQAVLDLTLNPEAYLRTANILGYEVPDDADDTDYDER
ncbi:MAG: hypothetical protein ACLPSH_11505 [Vulcanimicrobiaceae bacterium]